MDFALYSIKNIVKKLLFNLLCSCFHLESTAGARVSLARFALHELQMQTIGVHLYKYHVHFTGVAEDAKQSLEELLSSVKGVAYPELTVCEAQEVLVYYEYIVPTLDKDPHVLLVWRLTHAVLTTLSTFLNTSDQKYLAFALLVQQLVQAYQQL